MIQRIDRLKTLGDIEAPRTYRRSDFPEAVPDQGMRAQTEHTEYLEQRHRSDKLSERIEAIWQGGRVRLGQQQSVQFTEMNPCVRFQA